MKLKILSILLVFVSACSKHSSKNVNSHDRSIRLQISDLGVIRQIPDFKKMDFFVEKKFFTLKRQPNIYFILFDALRPDSILENNQYIKKFYDQNLSFSKAFATGTATVYSMYSLFNAYPAFLTYKTILKPFEQNEYGSIYLKILQKLGYKINIYGYDWHCVTESKKLDNTWNGFLTFFFGWNTRLLDRCQTDLKHDEEYNVNRDEITVEILKKRLPLEIIIPYGHVSFIAFYNNHTPYKWNTLQEDALQNVGDKEDFFNAEQTKNRYANSVRASDLNFKNTLDLINTLPGNEEAIIVLFSDHGEMLYEHKEISHGGIPYKEKNKILLSLHFGNNSDFHKLKTESSFASIIDIFPTIFDYLDIPLPNEFVVGRSLLSYVRDSVVIVQSNHEKPTTRIVLENLKYKAWINVNAEDFYHSSSFELVNVTDPNDNPIPLNDHFCFQKSEDKCGKIMRNIFKDAMREMYPDVNNNP